LSFTGRNARRSLGFAAAAAAGCLFALIAANIAAGDPLVELDAAASKWVLAHRNPALTLLMLGVTHAHAPFALCGYASIAGWYCWRRGFNRWLFALALAVPVGLALNFTLKMLFRRARPVPGDALMTLESYSFPSGHTAGATLFWGVLAAYAMSRAVSHRARSAIAIAWLCAIALVAFSRVYLGVHYVSDVLGACAWSLAWLAAALLIASRVGTPTVHV
jgi:membrane-associated phospholipid phosphatase